MLLEYYLKNYATWMFHKKNENWRKFQGPSLKQIDRKVLGQGLYFSP